MTVVAVILAAAVVATAMSSAALIRSLIRSQARERALMIDQILHLSGRTWTPPPADEWQPPANDEPLVREWTTQPEQHPYQV